MTDTLTTAKGLTKQTIGGNSNTWGTILNSTLDLIDKALGQTLTKSISGNVVLTSTEAQNLGFEFTGALAGAATVTWPTFYGPLFVYNNTTGGFAITVGMASGSTVTLLNGQSAWLYSDGGSFYSPEALTYGPVAYSPTDQSGAGLDLSTNRNVQYKVVDNLVTIYGHLVYPTQANGSVAKISLPLAVANSGFANVPGLANTTSTGQLILVAQQGTSTAQWEVLGTTVLNSALSGKAIDFLLTYPRS